MNSHQFFYADDWGWLRLGQFISWDYYLHLLPVSIYNDRPVGGLIIKALYQIFSLNHTAFGTFCVLMHAINCILLYFIASQYIPRASSFLVSVLAATWLSSLSALTWTAAIFDLLGATLCITTVWLRQMSVRRGGLLALDIVGALCFVLAIRTKEFALGTIALLFLINIIADRQKIGTAFKQLVPYFIVFVVFSARYAYLQAHRPIESTNLYSLDFSPASIFLNLGFYFSSLFYKPIVGEVGIACVVVLFALAALHSTRAAVGIAVIGLCGFAIMLGPTLLIPKHRDELYLYAPHFFMALAIGATYSHSKASKFLALALTVTIVLTPLASGRRNDVINFYETQGDANIAQLASAKEQLGALGKHTTVFITGMTPIFNPFLYGPGDSLRVVYKDQTLATVLGDSQDQLKPKFCEERGPKRFLVFHNHVAEDVSARVLTSCAQQ
jgi:hypothetical protein